MLPTWRPKLVFVAPRNRRLNSSILPRLRSHPIHSPSFAFHWRVRWNRKNWSVRSGPCLALSASMPARAAARISSSCGIVWAGASRTSLSKAKWMLASTLPRAWTSRWAISSLTRSTLSKIVGTITMVRASAGTDTSSSRGSRRGGMRLLMIRCTIWITSSLAGTAVRSATQTSIAPRQPYW